MTLTASVDIYSRATLTTTLSGASYVWKKNGTVFATTTVPTVTDNRPQVHYKYVGPLDASCVYTGAWSNFTDATQAATICPTAKRWDGDGAVTFTFTGVEIGLYFNRFTVDLDDTSEPDPAYPQTLADITIDGVTEYGVILDTRESSLYSQLVWGRAGLGTGTHVITIQPHGLVNCYFCGYAVNDQRTHYGDPVTYSVTANGTTETLAISPTVDRHAVLLDQISYRLTRIVNFFTSGGTDRLAYASRAADIAGMYYLTRDTDTSIRASLATAINSVYSEQMAAVDGNGLLPDASDNPGWLLNARAPYQWYFAYKIFGDARFLAYADQIITAALAGSNIWGGPGNQISAPLMSCAVLYNEPASAHYQQPSLLTLINSHLAAAWSNYNTSNHWLYYGSIDTRHPDVYQFFQWAHLRYLYSTLGLGDATNMANLTSYLATKDCGSSEPVFMEDTSYGTAGSGPFALLKAAIVAANGGAVPRDFIDMMYSAALDTGAWADYSPYGNAPHSGVPVDYGDGGTLFTWALSLIYPLGVLGKDVYGFDLTTARKLRSPSGGKIKGKGAGKVSGKPQ